MFARLALVAATILVTSHVAQAQTVAVSFQIATDSQKETDRYWNAIVGNGDSQCGWCKDRWGLS